MADPFNNIAGALLLAVLVVGVGTPAPAAPAAAAESTGAAKAAGKLEPVGALLAKASVNKGRRLVRACARCHSFKKNAARKVGPNLWGVVGANKGLDREFGYSPALKVRGGKWTYEELNAFLADPNGFVPGTRMDFPGFNSAEDRADVIAYLRSLADIAVALP